MKRFALLLLLLPPTSSMAQSRQPVLCKYKTFSEVNLRAEPDADSALIGKLPKSKTYQAVDKKSYWVKVQFKGMEGWAATTAMSRDESSCPRAPYLEIHSNGYKIIGDIHRNFFGVYNSGTADYTGKIKVGVYSGDRMLNEVEADFAARPIVESGGRTFYIDTYSRAERFVFEDADGKRSGVIGKFIERIED